MNNVEGAARPSMLKRKVLANSRFGYTTIYGNTTSNNLDVSYARVFIQTSDNQIDRFPDGSLFKNSVDVVLSASGLPAFRAIGRAKYSKTDSDELLDFIYIPGGAYTKNSYTLNPEETQIVASNTNMLNKFFRVGSTGGTSEMRYYDPQHDSWGNNNSYHVGNDPIPMQFKTGSNCVIQLSSSL